jgi:hypothetical protein
MLPNLPLKRGHPSYKVKMLQNCPLKGDHPLIWLHFHCRSGGLIIGGIRKDGRHHRETNFLSQIMEEEYPSIYEK